MELSEEIAAGADNDDRETGHEKCAHDQSSSRLIRQRRCITPPASPTAGAAFRGPDAGLSSSSHRL